MKVRIGGPVPMRFEMNGLMIAGSVFGLLGVATWVVDRYAVLPRGVPWDDVAMGVTLLGISLYFVGRLVDLLAHLRRKS